MYFSCHILRFGRCINTFSVQSSDDRRRQYTNKSSVSLFHLPYTKAFALKLDSSYFWRNISPFVILLIWENVCCVSLYSFRRKIEWKLLYTDVWEFVVKRHVSHRHASVDVRVSMNPNLYLFFSVYQYSLSDFQISTSSKFYAVINIVTITFTESE